MQAYPIPIFTAWPNPPATWSFSSLRVALDCPRRWALLRLPVVSAAPLRGTGRGKWGSLRGRVTHAAIEQLIKLHQTHKGPPAGSWSLVSFWGKHLPDGVSELLRGLIQKELSKLPKESPGLEALKERAREELGHLVTFVNAKFKTVLELSDGVTPRVPSEGKALYDGLYPELIISAERTEGAKRWSWSGTLDALIIKGDEITILDYKTGTESETDKAQLEMYAWLFWRDAIRNPQAKRVSSLVLLYWSGKVVQWSAPTEEQLKSFEGNLLNTTKSTQSTLSENPPPARLAPRCSQCEVRGLCDDYWREVPAILAAGSSIDVQVKVAQTSKDGSEVYGSVKIDGSSRKACVLLSGRGLTGLSHGSQLRVISAQATNAEDTTETTLMINTLESTSLYFQVADEKNKRP